MSQTCHSGGHSRHEAVMTHFHLGVCPHHVGDGLRVPGVHVLSCMTAGSLQSHNQTDLSGKCYLYPDAADAATQRGWLNTRSCFLISKKGTHCLHTFTDGLAGQLDKRAVGVG